MIRARWSAGQPAWALRTFLTSCAEALEGRIELVADDDGSVDDDETALISVDRDGVTSTVRVRIDIDPIVAVVVRTGADDHVLPYALPRSERAIVSPPRVLIATLPGEEMRELAAEVVSGLAAAGAVVVTTFRPPDEWARKTRRIEWHDSPSADVLLRVLRSARGIVDLSVSPSPLAIAGAAAGVPLLVPADSPALAWGPPVAALPSDLRETFIAIPAEITSGLAGRFALVAGRFAEVIEGASA